MFGVIPFVARGVFCYLQLTETMADAALDQMRCASAPWLSDLCAELAGYVFSDAVADYLSCMAGL